jgi:hypothetical protein
MFSFENGAFERRYKVKESATMQLFLAAGFVQG